MNKTEDKKRFSFSLSTTLAIAFFLLSVIVLVISSVVQIVAYYQTQQETIRGKQQVIAKEATSSVNTFIKEKRSVMETIVDLAGITSASRSRQQQILMGALGIQPAIRNLVLQDSREEVIVSASRVSSLDAERFVRMIKAEISIGALSGKGYISDVYIDDTTSEPMIIISVVNKDVFGDIEGILSAEVNLKFLWDLVDTLQVGESGYAYVVDKGGTLIAYKDTSRALKGENVSSVKVVEEFMRNVNNTAVNEIFTYQGLTGDDVVGTYVPLGTPNWAVITEMPVGEAYREVLQSTVASIIITLIMAVFAGGVGVFIAKRLAVPLINLTSTAEKISEGDTELEAIIMGSREIARLAVAFNSMTTQLRNKADSFKNTNNILKEIVAKAKEIVMNLNSAAKEIEAGAQEQTTAANQHASGITEVSATLQELTITAKQITNNVGELVLSSEEVIKFLREGEAQLLQTVSKLDDVGKISTNNAAQINELGKRSVLINEMVELIKEVANKTNILSINASIEASRSGEAGSGFSVVAAEIRELSKETIDSAKKVEKAAKEIQDFLNFIIVSSENESTKVMESGKTVKSIFDRIEGIVEKINSNYSFTQKIDVSIKQQESGSVQAAETMRQMAELARQSAENARQTLMAVRDIVQFSEDLDGTVSKFSPEEESE